MNHSQSKRIWKILVTLFFYVPSLLLILESNHSSLAADPSSFYYYVGDEQVFLPFSTNELTIKFVDGVTTSEKDAFFAGMTTMSEITELPEPNIAVLKYELGFSEIEYLKKLDDLRANPRVEFAYPVFKFPDARMTLTNQFVARFNPDVTTEMIDAFNTENGVEMVEAMRLADTYILSVEASADSLAMANQYHGSDLTIYATPNFVRFLTPQFTPNDAHYPNQWGMENTGTNPPDGVGTADADIDASTAWDISLGDSDVVIAIIDEGVELAHEDLDGKIVGNYSAITGDPNGGNPNNTWDAHGTNCAGIATAESNNAQGVAGVCPNCSLMAVQIAYSSFEGGDWITSDSWIADAITWAVNNGADVLSNSWGGGSPSSLINDAITHAITNGRDGLGSSVLFSTGNENASIQYPATNNDTIAVGASSPCDERKNPSSCDGENWWGSNYGSALDVVSPGVEWWSTDMMGSAGYDPGNYYDHMNGTSSATPSVAGLAGLILSHRPCLTEAQVQEIIEQSAQDQVGPPAEDTAGWDQYMGWGRVNAHNALVLANSYPCGGFGCHRILFDETHGNSWTFTIGDLYSELAGLLVDGGHAVDALQDPDPFNYATISQYDVLALVLPVEYYTTDEKAAIAQFVNEGGRLVTISEYGSFVTVESDILNDVHAYLGDGLSHNEDLVNDPTNFVTDEYWPLIHTFPPDPVNNGVTTIIEFAGSSLQVSGSAFGTAFGDEDTYIIASGATSASGPSDPAIPGYKPFASEVSKNVDRTIPEGKAVVNGVLIPDTETEKQPEIADPAWDPVAPEYQNTATTEGLDLPQNSQIAPLAAGDILAQWPTGLAAPWGTGFNLDDGAVWIGNIAAAGGDDYNYEFLTNGSLTGRSVYALFDSGVWGADIAFNPLTGRFWQVNVSGDNCIYEWDPSTGQTGNLICGTTWTVTSQRGLAYDPTSETFYIGGWNEGIIYHIDSAGNVLNSWSLGLGIAGLAYNWQAELLFIIESSLTDAVSVFDVNTGTIIDSFTIPGFGNYAAAGLAIDCDGNLWAANQVTYNAYLVDSGVPADLCSSAVIDFDDQEQPCGFILTVALRDEYLPLGVSFDGPDENDGGAILDQCGNFSVSGYSPPNFLAFNGGSMLSDGGIPQPPERISFTQPVTYVEIKAGSYPYAGYTLSMDAYDSADNLLGSDSIVLDPALQTLQISTANISYVVINSAADVFVLDDLNFETQVIVQARSNVGAGDVFAIGDGDIFSNEDYDSNGIISLFEFDNAQLAHNVFAFGETCSGYEVYVPLIFR